MSHDSYGYNQKGSATNSWDSFKKFAKDKQLLQWAGVAAGAIYGSDFFGGGLGGMLMGSLVGGVAAYFVPQLIGSFGNNSHNNVAPTIRKPTIPRGQGQVQGQGQDITPPLPTPPHEVILEPRDRGRG